MCSCCEDRDHHRRQGCCCDDEFDGGFERRFQTKAEQIEELEAYLEELKLEMRAVEETLADLRR
jgi:hypothetical protein